MSQTTAPTPQRAAVLQQYEKLQQRAESLKTRVNRAQFALESSRKEHAAAMAEAERTHGTTNLDELRDKVIRDEAADAQAVRDYEAALDALESYIERIEKALADPEAMAALIASIEIAKVQDTPAPAASAAPAFVAEDI